MHLSLLALLVFLVSGALGATYKFADETEVHDEGHIKQHLENKIEVEKLTEEQQRFHYFSMHDLNKDNFIDGIEILKALTHDHGDHDAPRMANTDEGEMERLVDAVLDDLDTNGDGVIDYSEYLKRQ